MQRMCCGGGGGVVRLAALVILFTSLHVYMISHLWGGLGGSIYHRYRRGRLLKRKKSSAPEKLFLLYVQKRCCQRFLTPSCRPLHSHSHLFMTSCTAKKTASRDWIVRNPLIRAISFSSLIYGVYCIPRYMKETVRRRITVTSSFNRYPRIGWKKGGARGEGGGGGGVKPPVTEPFGFLDTIFWKDDVTGICSSWESCFMHGDPGTLMTCHICFHRTYTFTFCLGGYIHKSSYITGVLQV